MIQRPAPGTFDLELGYLAHTGQKLFTVTASEVFQHLQSPLDSARLRPARASSEGLGWLAASTCDLVTTGGGLNTRCGRPLFFIPRKRKSPELVGAF
jgi:hypothetical protein